MKPKIIIPAYCRNVRAALKTSGNRAPNGYTTSIATNGDFVVYSSAMDIIGRLSPDKIEPFVKTDGK